MSLAYRDKAAFVRHSLLGHSAAMSALHRDLVESARGGIHAIVQLRIRRAQDIRARAEIPKHGTRRGQPQAEMVRGLLK